MSAEQETATTPDFGSAGSAIASMTLAQLEEIVTSIKMRTLNRGKLLGLLCGGDDTAKHEIANAFDLVRSELIELNEAGNTAIKSGDWPTVPQLAAMCACSMVNVHTVENEIARRRSFN